MDLFSIYLVNKTMYCFCTHIVHTSKSLKYNTFKNCTHNVRTAKSLKTLTWTCPIGVPLFQSRLRDDKRPKKRPFSGLLSVVLYEARKGPLALNKDDMNPPSKTLSGAKPPARFQI